MSLYESTVIFSPEVPPEQLEIQIDKIKQLVEKSEGKVTLADKTGRKRLAYPIKKHREGYYMYFELSGPGTMVASLENFYKINDTIIRYLTVKTVKKVRPVKAKESKPAEASEDKAESKPVEVNTDEHKQSSSTGTK